MEMIIRPGGFFIMFQLIRYLPYIAIGSLIAAIVIWVIFGVKKFRWAKILAIILTVIVFFTGLASLAPFVFRGLARGHLPNDQGQFREWDREKNTDASLKGETLTYGQGIFKEIL